MQIIKEYCEKVSCAVVRTNTYGSTLGFLNNLFEEAKKDYPWLTEHHCTVKYYGGQHYARTFGIEFNVPEQHSSYVSIPQLEYVK